MNSSAIAAASETADSTQPLGYDSTPSEIESRLVSMFGILLCLAGLLAYQSSFQGVFLFDDYSCIVQNESIRSLESTLHATRDQIPGGLSRRPVGRWSFALNYALGGLNPWGYHATNLAIHLAAGLLLMGLVRRTLQLPQMPATVAQHAPWLAFCIALLWLVHPLQTESVTYIVQRLESLMAMFFLGSLYCLLRGATGGSPLWYLAAVVTGLASIGTKEVGLMLLPVALLYDRLFLATDWKQVFQHRRWFHLAIFAATVLFVVVSIGRVPLRLQRTEKPGRVYLSESDYKVTSWEYLRTQPEVLLHYGKLTFWPRDLCLDYAWPVARDVWAIYGKGAIILAILGTGAVLLRRRPATAFLILSFFFVLAPSSSVVPLHLAFEHRMYLPLAALISGVVIAGYRLAWHAEYQWGFTQAGRVAFAGVLLVAMLLGFATHQRNQLYHDPIAMWQDVLRVSPGNSRAHHWLATSLSEVGELERADEHFRISLELTPGNAERAYNYGYFLANYQGRPDDAATWLQRSLELYENNSVAWQGYANLLEELERYDDAEQAYQRAIEIDQGNVNARLRLAQMLRKLARHAEAGSQLDIIIEMAPRIWQPHYERMQIALETNDTAAALVHLTKAIELSQPRTPEFLLAERQRLQQQSSEVPQ